ncbi:MAG: helix-turn-helix transcriptional regulator [Rhodocyclaceae bacterium]|nr:helix-turn-helix transcriptional regulator [Rhodocyclaceae bacterium]
MKAAREALGLTQDALALAVGGSKRGIQNNEALKSVPGGEVICGLVCLGINANWLLTGEGSMLLSDLAPKPAETPINEPALAMILAGILMGMGERPDPERAARKAVQYYQDALAEGLITPTGIGSGGRSAA